MKNEKSSTKVRDQSIGIGIALGVAIGAAMGNVGLGIAVGVALGVAIGVKKQKELDANGPTTGSPASRPHA